MIRRFNRYELKYVLPVRQCEHIMEELAVWLPPDQHSGTKGYRILSLYYDSPAHDFFWAKIEGLKFRRKVRMRAYVQEGSLSFDRVLVEIKQRINRTVQKRRLLLPLDQALLLCDEHRVPEGLDPLDRQVAHEIAYLGEAMHLRPAAITAYWRKAFEGARESAGLRVTFDFDVRGRTHALDMTESAENHLILPPDWCIMEVKANEAVPDWLTSVLARFNCSVQRVSKYCAVVAQHIDRRLMPLCLHPSAPEVPLIEGASSIPSETTTNPEETSTTEPSITSHG